MNLDWEALKIEPFGIAVAIVKRSYILSILLSHHPMVIFQITCCSCTCSEGRLIAIQVWGELLPACIPPSRFRDFDLTNTETRAIALSFQMSDSVSEVLGLCQSCKVRNEIPYGNFDHLASSRLPPMGLGSGRVPIDFGSIGEIARRQHQCSFCRIVILAISTSWRQTQDTLIAESSSVECTLCNRLIGVIRESNTDEVFGENFYENKFRFAHCRLEIDCDTAPPGCPSRIDIQVIDGGAGINGLFDDAPLFSRRPHEKIHEIDFGLVKRWISHCKRNHHVACQPDEIPSGCTDAYLDYFRLIDVVKKKVVKGAPEHEYAALSYVWGLAPFLQLVKSTKSSLYQEGAFDTHAKDVPSTIRDAIQVMEKIGVRYLWVDALCIMQDDPTEKAYVIGAMDAIYSRAQLTIVAAAGTHANSGLPGIRPGSRDLQSYEVRASFPESSRGFVVARERPSMAIQKSIWDSRGWTYQERLCSHRLLIFTEQQVVYLCGKSSWCEDTVLETDSPRVYYEEKPLAGLNLPNDKTDSFLRTVGNSNPKPPFQEYVKLVDAYTSRNLTYPGDILDAFTGALERFRGKWDAQGIEIAFLFGLPTTWLDLGLMWTVEHGSSNWNRRDSKWLHPSGVRVSFPSWSWMGWKGKIAGIVRPQVQLHTQPEIQWHYIEPGSNAVRQIISHSTSHEENSQITSSSGTPNQLPELWKPACAPTFVTQTHLQGFNMHDLAGKLVFLTSTCVMSFIGLQHPFTDEINQYGFPDSRGIIYLDPVWAEKRIGQQFEFIVLSSNLQTRSEDFDDFQIMLVERRQKILYRIGIGWIESSVWVKANPTWQMVVLG